MGAEGFGPWASTALWKRNRPAGGALWGCLCPWIRLVRLLKGQDW